MEDSSLSHIISRTDHKRYFYYTPVMVELLHLVAKVPKQIIKQTKIYCRSAERYIPFYPAHRGGGAITLGSDTWQSITFTENFFSKDQQRYNGRAYADNISSWLGMSAHEAGHLIHAKRFRFFIFYLVMFVYQYLRYGHDAAPLEVEAEIGRKNLIKFQAFLNQKYGTDTLENLLTSDDPDYEKIQKLKDYWAEHIIQMNPPSSRI